MHQMSRADFEDKIELIYKIFNSTFIVVNHFSGILQDHKKRTLFYNPDLKSITFISEYNNVELSRINAEELTHRDNKFHLLGWQVIYAITGFSAIFEYYIKSTIERTIDKPFKKRGNILDSFIKETGIELSQLAEFEKVKYCLNVRHISLHNYGIRDERFNENINALDSNMKPFVYTPILVMEYYNALLSLSSFIEQKLDNNVN